MKSRTFNFGVRTLPDEPPGWTANTRSAGFQPAVSRISNPPPLPPSNGLPTGSRRHSRLEICATISPPAHQAAKSSRPATIPRDTDRLPVCATGLPSVWRGASSGIRPKTPLPVLVSRPWKTGSSAFTLLELLVVVSIMGLLAVVGLPMLKGFGQSTITKNAIQQLQSDLAYARQKAMSERTTV